MENQKVIPDRRNGLRYKMRTPVFAIFDGVGSGMILDLSERGLSMLSPAAVEPNRTIPLRLNLSEPATSLETTGYVAWADTLGRAGIRFSELPEEGRVRLQQWLTVHANEPSTKAPKFTLDDSIMAELRTSPSEIPTDLPRTLYLEGEPNPSGKNDNESSSTVQFEFKSLGLNLDAALQEVVERAQVLTRGTGAAVALSSNGSLTCRASAGTAAPALGVTVDINNGFSGGCIRTGRTLRCDDAETDPRVDAMACKRLAVRSIIAAPIQYDRQVVGLLEVFSTQPFAFDEGDVAIVERLARTALLSVSQNAQSKR